ncbi:dipeptidyl peptidase 4-like isoform X2 [Mya arenaria]|uniref:dipeptidyl peptidase 4-like isoform X2 n=1 Tax=Mya arenaria TaxID=6604 RepID=UPI0022E3A344|nr:dipeptidyl peptidase 4-like isoform X2 [Mya arenaria]
MANDKDEGCSNAAFEVGTSQPKTEGKGNGKELVGHTVQKRNWKGIVIALVVIIAVCALIVATIILLNPKNSNDPPKPKFTFEDFMSKKYAPKYFSYQWMKGAAALYFRNDDGAVLRYNCSTNTSVMIMDNSTFKQLETSSYTISPDETFALLPYDIKQIYRHSTKAKYKIFNITSKQDTNLEGPDGLEFQYVSWSPTYNGLVFVQNNDIFYRRNMDLSIKEAFRVTNTGVVDKIFNGVPDWVYEEEVLSIDNAIWWSPDGGHFLYASFNDSQIGLYDLTYYGPLTQQYVTNKRLLYPKAGTTNPTFTLNIFNTNNNSSLEIQPPQILQDQDHYFTTVTWGDNDTVLITWMNRHQNMTLFTACDAVNGTCKENYRFLAPSGWCEVFTSPVFTSDGQNFFFISPQLEGEAGPFRHVTMVNIQSGGSVSPTFITTGLFDVISIVKYIPATETMYYLAYRTGDPTSRHLYKITTDTDASNFKKPECVTCHLAPDCDWLSASFSDTSGGEFFMLQCLGPSVPTTRLYSTASETVVSFEDNKAVAEGLAKLSMPRPKYVRIPLQNGESMWGKLLLPEGLKEDEIIKYNMLTNVYGGPDSQKVTKSFQLGWEDYLSSTHNIVIGFLDAPGSSGRGDKWRHANYRNLGTTEVDGTITAGRYFNSLRYVSDRTAIWGWSYGGFLTSMVLGQGTGTFDCGMAVAPVTDYRYYDSIYTERYMGLPDDNLEAYNRVNVSRYADNFKKSKFMIVHGTGDDNVHFQNSAQLVRALTEANVYFRSQFYTDQQHSINGGNSRKHLYNTLEDFLLQCLGGTQSHIDDLNNKNAADSSTNTEKDDSE